MNIFLLEPQRRLLSAFIWIASSNTIGLYVLFDWEAEEEDYEYIYIDTGIECVSQAQVFSSYLARNLTKIYIGHVLKLVLYPLQRKRCNTLRGC